MNEDALVLKQLAAAMKSKNLDTTASLYSDADSLKNPEQLGTSDIDSADLIILAGLNPSQWTRVLPALDAAVRRRVNSGAKAYCGKFRRYKYISSCSIKPQRR